MRLLLLAVLLLHACDGDDDTPPDSGVFDSGLGPDGCALGDPARDSSVNVGPCNPASGTGCEISAGRFCVWDLDGDEGECRCLGDAPKAVGEPCSPTLEDCAAGLACLSLGGAAPTCHQVCTQTNPVECDALSTTDTVYACFPIVRTNGSATSSFGLCLPAGRPCEPLDDQCAATETCALITTSSAVCQPSGTVPIGGDCTAEECSKGGVCVPLQDQNGNSLGIRCYEPCDLSTPACSAGMCADVGIQGFGLCI